MQAILLLGDQLFEGLPGLPRDLPIFMQEDPSLATRFRHHPQKLVLIFSAMRHQARALQAQGRPVHYWEFDRSNPPLRERLIHAGVTDLHTYEPHDRFFLPEIESRFRVRTVPSPAFLTSDQDWAAYAKGKRRLMGDFYRQQRQRLDVLMEPGGEPIGRRWSFDEENRRSIPKGIRAPAPNHVEPDDITEATIQMVKREFGDHPGRLDTFGWPVTHDAAREWLDRFLALRFEDFGPYEDAISRDDAVLWHSQISPLLNIGLLTPHQVVKSALEREHVSLASREGFIRQVIGWREFIKRIDQEYGTTHADARSFFGHTRQLGPAWWSASTGVPPLDTAIQRCLQTGYCHHIERLMVLGAGMLMCEVDPQEAYRWFMEMFIDSAEWVMAPNVFGMSQFSDGGVFATKPYLSGSAYLLKMSDYGRGDWCTVWDGLYWRFIDRNRAFFQRNPRMSVLAKGVDRLDPVRRDAIFAAADTFIQKVTLAPNPIHSPARS